MDHAVELPQAQQPPPSPPKLHSRHRGSEYLRSINVEVSPLGERVADLLGHLYKGLYHCDSKALKDARWNDDYFIEFRLDACRLSTCDFNDLTELVVLCHDLCIRCQISPCNQQKVKLLFHGRAREGSMSKRHPTMEDATQMIREYYTVEIAQPITTP